MQNWISVFFALFIAVSARAETLVMRGATMGTTYQIKLVAERDSVDLHRLHAEVENALAEIDKQMSTYRRDSELSRFNRAMAGDWFAVSRATAEVVAASQEISRLTGGAMDVTVGPLVNLWHFGPDANGERTFVPPTDDAIAEARKRVGFQRLAVRFDPPALRKDIDGLQVDLSSIAPGFAIDQLAEIIAKHGVKNFMVELGGEVRASGAREDGKTWRVAVERPADGGRTMQTAVPLADAAIATAGDYRKFFVYGGKRYSHVIDPSSGRPVEHSLASVTVVADTCIEADGWDTPLLVLGPERGFECAEANGVAAMFISGNDGKNIRITRVWRRRFAASHE
jgi:thiamine biosynthesis lipoprotein